jgi:hypothetical protein
MAKSVMWMDRVREVAVTMLLSLFSDFIGWYNEYICRP